MKKTKILLQLKNYIQKVVIIHTTTSVYQGVLLAIDQYMNVVLKDTVETIQTSQQKRLLGLILLKGEQISYVIPTPIALTESKQLKIDQKSNTVNENMIIQGRESQQVNEENKQKFKIPGLKGLPGLKK